MELTKMCREIDAHASSLTRASFCEQAHCRDPTLCNKSRTPTPPILQLFFCVGMLDRIGVAVEDAAQHPR